MSKRKPECSCIEHDDINEGDKNKYFKFANKKVKRETREYMIKTGNITTHALGICESCKNHFDIISRVNRSTPIDIDNIVKAILNNELCQEELMKLAEALGQIVNNNIAKTNNTDDNIYTPEFTNNECWLSDKNTLLQSFIDSCIGLELCTNPKKKQYKATAIQAIYKAKNLNYVAPMPFYTNVLTYYLSGSSTLCNLLGKVVPAGCYQTVKKWVDAQGQQQIKPLANTRDTVTFFDNNQVLCRNWRVNYNYKCKASVITTVATMQTGPESQVQQNKDLNPTNWLYNTCDPRVLLTEIEKSEKYIENIRNMFLQNRIQKICGKMSMENGKWTDDISRFIADGVLPVLEKSEKDPYNWIDSNHPEENTQVHVEEPIMVNPCSFEAVKKVLNHIKVTRDVTDETWTSIGCDGGPYVLGQKLLASDKQLRNILLVPGNGHIEMNTTKMLFKLLWNIILKDIVELHGFKSPRAKLSIKSCSDHHKAWAILNIFFYGTMDEILTTYISAEGLDNCSVQGFYTYIGASEDPNYRFMCDILFKHCFPLLCFRCGVRRGNASVIDAGRNSLMKLFFGTSVPNYQMLLYHHLKTKTLAPEQVRLFMDSIESMSVSGHDSKGEGGDFILESVNRKIKRWLPPGVPLNKHWTNICRNLGKLEKLRENVHKDLHVTDNEPTMYQRDYSLEMFHWRVHLRKSSYLDNSKTRHISLSGIPLDGQLVNFEQVCTKNLNVGIAAFSNRQRCQMDRIVVTREDREAADHDMNKTKSELSLMIEDSLEKIQNTNERSDLRKEWMKIKGLTKPQIYDFFKKLTYMDDVDQNDTDIEENDEDDTDDDSDDADNNDVSME